MPVTVKIQDQSGAGRIRATTTLEGISSKITLRDLMRTRVREEVARYNAGPQPTHEGFRMPHPRRIDWQQQADRAIQAFQRNGFFVLVDDRQVTEFDEPLDLTADSDIRFIRLVQLTGG
jgi:cell division protein FtsN